MFESVLATVLNRILGNYISNLEQKQLNIAIWQGDLTLKGLSLRKEALDGLSLPIEVLEGYLGELRIKIPWQNLKGKPVEIYIDKLFLLAVPRFETKYDKNQTNEREYRWKMNKLDAAELMQNDLNIEDPQDQSFMNQLVTKIIDNLQINIQTVHIRYEDHVSHPGCPFSFGVTLSLLSATSTDSNWVESFVHDSPSAIHKLLKMYGLAIYCNTGTNFVRLNRESPQSLLDSFEQLIAKAKYATSDDTSETNKYEAMHSHQYLLRPISGFGHLAIQKKIKPLVQKYAHEANLLTTLLDSLLSKNYVSLFFDELSICLDDQQYQELLNLSRMFQRYEILKQYISIRPAESSINDNPLAWFQYAGNAVLKVIHTRNFKLSWEYMKQRKNQRIEYIDLYTKKLEQIVLCKKPANVALSAEEAARLKALEIEIDVNDLLIYRRRVTEYVQNELRQAEEKKLSSEELLSKQSNNSGWFSSLPFWASWGASSPDTSLAPNTIKPEENVPLDVPNISVLTEKDMQQLYDAIDYHDSDSVSNATETSTAITSLASSSKPSSPLDIIPSATKPFYYYDLHHLQLHLKRGSFSVKCSGQLESVIELSFNNFIFQFLLRERVSDRKGSHSRVLNAGRDNELKFGSNWLSRIEIGNLVAEDSVSRHSIYKYLLKSGKFCRNEVEPEEASFVKMAYLNLPYDDSTLDGRFETEMQSLMAIINRPLFERLASFFTSSKLSDEISENIFSHATKKLEELRVYTTANLANVLANHPKIQVKINMDAPVLILPINVESISDPLIVVDLGKLRIESDHIDFTNDPLPKIDTSLFVEVEPDDTIDLAYEKFHCQLVRAQAHFSQSAEFYFNQVKQNNRGAYSNINDNLYVIHPTDISMMVMRCLVAKDAFLPGFKIYIQFENSLQMQLSDLSYQTGMILFDTFFPDDENDRLHTVLKDRKSKIIQNGTINSNNSNEPVNSFVPNHSNYTTEIDRNNAYDSESESVTYFDAVSSFSSGMNNLDSVPKILRKTSVDSQQY